MFKSPFAIAVWMVVVSVLLRMIVFVNNWQLTDLERIYFLGNIFVLMIGVYLALRLFKRTTDGTTTFFEDFRAALRLVGLYAVMMAVFVYVYYTYVDPGYFVEKLHRQLTAAAESDMDLEQVRKTGELILSAYFQSTVTLIGFLIMGSFYSAIMTFLVRRKRIYKEVSV